MEGCQAFQKKIDQDTSVAHITNLSVKKISSHDLNINLFKMEIFFVLQIIMTYMFQQHNILNSYLKL